MMRVSTFALLTVVAASAAFAQPELVVTFEGVNSAGNNTWAARIAPDPNLFWNTTSGYGGSIAFELAFAVEGSEFVSITKNGVNYDFDIPGFNPFTAPDFTEGIWTSSDSTKAFASLGGRVFFPADPSPHDALFFETEGDQLTTLLYGSAASGDGELGAMIAQRGLIFTVPEVPLSLQAMSATFADGLADAPVIGDNVFFGFGGSVSSIPEPSSIAMFAGLAIAAVALRRAA